MTLATMKASLAVEETNAAVLAANPKWIGLMDFVQSFSDGTTAGKFDLVYMSERTVATGANDDIDLAGVLTSPLGDTITAAEIVAVFLINRQKNGTVNTTDLTIGAGTNPWIGVLGATHTIGPIKPGGMVMIGAGDAAGIGVVTAGTGDILRVANSAGAANTYQIGILARSA